MKPKILSRLDIRTRRDRGGAHVLEYTGRGLSFLDVIYGFDAGVFFAVVPSEIEAPEATQQLAQSCGIVADDHPDMPAFRRAVTHALLTEAMVIAPELLSELAEPQVMWADRDLHELQRRHREALHAVNVTVNTIENDLRRRVALTMRTEHAPFFRPSMAPAGMAWPSPIPRTPPVMAHTPPLARGVQVWPEVPEVIEPRRLSAQAPVDPAPVVERIVAEVGPDGVPCIPDSQSVERVLKAVVEAREAELPQRLPGGARRRLEKLPVGVYLAVGDNLIPKGDMTAAMIDGQEEGRKSEAVVIDWNGEWPVVARRFGSGGRVVYKVEQALKRALGEEAA